MYFYRVSFWIIAKGQDNKNVSFAIRSGRKPDAIAEARKQVSLEYPNRKVVFNQCYRLQSHQNPFLY